MTFYDDATGERVELSVTTYANWVAKAASLLVDEHDLERGDTLRIDLPPHWLGPGLPRRRVDRRPGGRPTPTTRTPSCAAPTSLDRVGGAAPPSAPVLACSLLPLGVRFAEPLPPGVHDVGVEIWSQPDAFIAVGPAGADDLAVRPRPARG